MAVALQWQLYFQPKMHTGHLGTTCHLWPSIEKMAQETKDDIEVRREKSSFSDLFCQAGSH